MDSFEVFSLGTQANSFENRKGRHGSDISAGGFSDGKEHSEALVYQ